MINVRLKHARRRVRYLFLSAVRQASRNRRVRPLERKIKKNGGNILRICFCDRRKQAVGRDATRRYDVPTAGSLREIVIHKVDDDGAQRDSDRVTQGGRADGRASERANKWVSEQNFSTSPFSPPAQVHHYFPFPRDTSLMRRDDCSLQTCQGCQPRGRKADEGGELNGKLVAYSFQEGTMENEEQ